MSFDENPFSAKKDKHAEGFQIFQFYWLFSSEIVAVKGLM